jgi:hypothetical protein
MDQRRLGGLRCDGERSIDWDERARLAAQRRRWRSRGTIQIAMDIIDVEQRKQQATERPRQQLQSHHQADPPVNEIESPIHRGAA